MSTERRFTMISPQEDDQEEILTAVRRFIGTTLNGRRER